MGKANNSERSFPISLILSLLASLVMIGSVLAYWITSFPIRSRMAAFHLVTFYTYCWAGLWFLSIFAPTLAILRMGRERVRGNMFAYVASMVGCVCGLSWGYAFFRHPIEFSNSLDIVTCVIYLGIPVVFFIYIGSPALVGVLAKKRPLTFPVVYILNIFFWLMIGISLTTRVMLPPFVSESNRMIVTRVKHDMPRVATAIEAYYDKNEAYPLSSISPEEQIPFAANIPMTTFRKWTSKGPATLTTPIAYLKSYPEDFFSTYVRPASTFVYWAPQGKAKGWILLSPGPNCVYDIDFPTLQKVYRPAEPNPTKDLIVLSYDASNGTDSAGDIFRVMERPWSPPPPEYDLFYP